MYRLGRSLVFTALAALVLLGLATSAATAAGSASIKGAVSGTPIPETVEVCAYREDQGAPIECADATGGEYELAGLAAGTYFVAFRSAGCTGGCHFVPQWFEGVRRRADATPVVLAEGQQASGIDAMVAENSLIEGQVLDATDNEPATGFEVCAYRPGQSRPVACSSDSFEGYYRVGGLTEGESYEVQFRPETSCLGGSCTRQNWDPQWYPGVANRPEATLVEPHNNPDINASLQPAAKITGTITEAVGAAAVPSGSVKVCAFPSGNESANGTCAEVGSNGKYTIQGIPSGETVIRFEPNFYCSGTCQHADFAPQWFEGKASAATAEPVTLTSGQTRTGVDAAMAPGGKIHGTVTAASGGAAIANATVCASVPNVGGPCTQTNSVGEYTLVGLGTLGYNVSFRATSGSYATQSYQGVANESEATLIQVTAGATTNGIDAALTAAASLSGTVTEAGGAPLEEAYVCAYPGASTEAAGCAQSASDGTYTIEGLSPADYKIHFAGPEDCGGEACTAANLVGQWYSAAASRSAAASVTLAAGQSQTAVDASLQFGGRIAGTVTVPGGGASRSVEVCARPAAGGEPAACGYTEGDGYYEIAGLATGSYTVEFIAGDECSDEGCELSEYEVQFWHGAAAPGVATPVAVTVGSTQRDIDATMGAPGAPVAAQPPTVTGTPAVGQTLSCGQGEWGGNPTAYAYAWLRDGAPIAGAAGTTYTLTAEDVGHAIACRVTGTNDLGSTAADSAALQVPKASTPDTPATSTTSAPSTGSPQGAASTTPAGKASAKRTAKVKAGKAAVIVKCTGGPCKGRLKLTMKSKGKKVVVGQASFSLAVGKTATVKVKLSKAAISMVEGLGSKGLRVSLTGSGITPRSLKLSA